MGKRRSRLEKMKISGKKLNSGATLLNMEESECDSDVQEFVLPKRKIIKPGRSARRRLGGCCRTCASVFISLILIASILCVLVLGWFSLRLKRDLNALHNRLSEVESYDRSSTREFTSLKEGVTKKITGLRDEEAKKSVIDDTHYRSLIAQIAYLNKTVKELSESAKSPKSVVSISHDIDQLKKGMADTGQEITAVRDTVTKLTKLAHLQHRALKSLQKEFYNLSSEVAKLTGKPKPTAPTTGTLPLILQMPVNEPTKSTGSESQPHTTRHLYNISRITSEIKQVITVVRKINGTFVDEANRLKTDLDGMKSVFQKHKVQFAALEKQVKGLEENFTVGSNFVEPKTSKPYLRTATSARLSSQIHNLTRTVKKVADFLLRHQKKFYKMEQDVTEMNKTVYRHHTKLGPQLVATAVCNCTKESSAVKELWHNVSYEHQHLLSLHSKLKKLESLTLQFVKTSKKHFVKHDENLTGNSTMKNSHSEKTKKSGKKDLSQEVGLNVTKISLPGTGVDEDKLATESVLSNTTREGENVELNTTVLSSVPTPKPTIKKTTSSAIGKEEEIEDSLESRR